MAKDPASTLSPEFALSLASATFSDLERIAQAYGEIFVTGVPNPDGTWGYTVGIKFVTPQWARVEVKSDAEETVIEAHRGAIVRAEYIRQQLRRFHETINQQEVQNPVRPKGEAGNLNPTKRENALKAKK